MSKTGIAVLALLLVAGTAAAGQQAPDYSKVVMKVQKVSSTPAAFNLTAPTSMISSWWGSSPVVSRSSATSVRGRGET